MNAFEPTGAVLFGPRPSRTTGCGGKKSPEEAPAVEDNLAQTMVDNNPASHCEPLKGDKKGYHLCLLEKHLKIHEDYKRSKVVQDIARDEKALATAEDEVSFWDNPLAATKNYLFSLSRSVLIQNDNWLLLDIAGKYKALSDLTRDRSVPMVDYDAFLLKAEAYLKTALANPNTSICFDIYRSPFEQTIWPVEAYFELQLTRLSILLITNPGVVALSPAPAEQPGTAVELAQTLRGDLQSPRFLQAQRSNPKAAEGYLNRLRVMEIDQLLTIENIGETGELPPVMAELEAIKKWTAAEKGRLTTSLAIDGMSLVDLTFDELRVTNLEGRILFKLGRFDEAAAKFREVLGSPAATRKYGGFIDQGLDAAFHLLLYSLQTSGDAAAAADKFAASTGWGKDWAKLPADMRQALGLEVRNLDFCFFYSHASYLTCVEPKDIIGNITLGLGWDSLIPRDRTLALSSFMPESNREKLEVMMRALELISTDLNLKNEVFTRWLALNN